MWLSNNWSTNNTLILIYCTLATVLTALLVETPFLSAMLAGCQIPAPYQGLGVTAMIVALAVAFYLLGAELAPLMITGSLATFVCLTFNQDELVRYLTLAAMLFSIGIYGMTVSRNAVRVLMSIELMLNAVNLNLVAFSRYIDPAMIKGQLFAIFILTVAAAEAAVGLAIVLAIYRNTSSVDMEKFTLLKW